MTELGSPVIDYDTPLEHSEKKQRMMHVKPTVYEERCDELGIQSGDRLWTGGHHIEAKKLTSTLFESCHKPPTGPLDNAIITPKSLGEAAYFAGKLKDRLSINGNIWVVVQEKPVPNIETGSPTADRVTAQRIRTELSKLGFKSAKTVRLSSDFLAIGFKASRGNV